MHSRRDLLKGALGLAALTTAPETAWGIGPGSELTIARLRYPGSSKTRRNALNVLAEEVRLQTSVDVSLTVDEVSPAGKLFSYPLLFAICDKSGSPLSSRQGTRLKSWLEAGGTLFVDNVGTTGPSESFDQRFRRDMEELFPRNPLVKIPADHVLYRSFYRLDYPAGRRITRSYLEALVIEGRVAMIYSQNDLTGAWSRDAYGSWEYDVTPGGERQRQGAIRLGINVVEYALCQDYKDDQVHMDYLLHKRKWKPRRSRLGQTR